MFKMGCSKAKKMLALDSNKSQQAAAAGEQQATGSRQAARQQPDKPQAALNSAPAGAYKRPTGEELNDFSKLQEDPRLPLNVRQIFKITKSWKAIARTMSKTGTAMFLNLFEQNQDLFYLFDRFQHLKGKELHESMELREHAATVMSTLDQSINSLSDYDNFVIYLHSIGELHRKVPGFQRAHFWKIEQPFLKAVKQTLDERCNETIEEIYKIAIKLIIETIAEGYGLDAPAPSGAPHAHPSDSQQGGPAGGAPGGSASGGGGVGGEPGRTGADGSRLAGAAGRRHGPTQQGGAPASEPAGDPTTRQTGTGGPCSSAAGAAPDQTRPLGDETRPIELGDEAAGTCQERSADARLDTAPRSARAPRRQRWARSAPEAERASALFVLRELLVPLNLRDRRPGLVKAAASRRRAVAGCRCQHLEQRRAERPPNDGRLSVPGRRPLRPFKGRRRCQCAAPAKWARARHEASAPLAGSGTLINCPLGYGLLACWPAKSATKRSRCVSLAAGSRLERALAGGAAARRPGVRRLGSGGRAKPCAQEEGPELWAPCGRATHSNYAQLGPRRSTGRRPPGETGTLVATGARGADRSSSAPVSQPTRTAQAKLGNSRQQRQQQQLWWLKTLRHMREGRARHQPARLLQLSSSSLPGAGRGLAHQISFVAGADGKLRSSSSSSSSSSSGSSSARGKNSNRAESRTADEICKPDEPGAACCQPGSGAPTAGAQPKGPALGQEKTCHAADCTRAVHLSPEAGERATSQAGEGKQGCPAREYAGSRGQAQPACQAGEGRRHKGPSFVWSKIRQSSQRLAPTRRGTMSAGTRTGRANQPAEPTDSDRSGSWTGGNLNTIRRAAKATGHLNPAGGPLEQLDDLKELVKLLMFTVLAHSSGQSRAESARAGANTAETSSGPCAGHYNWMSNNNGIGC